MKPIRRTSLRWMFPITLVILSAFFAITSCGRDVSNANEVTGVPTETSIRETSTQEVSEEIDTTAVPEIAVLDQRGVEVILDGPAMRIISIAPSNTEILFAIGAGNQVVGRDDVSDYPPEALELESIGSTYGELNTEAIISLDPDLVLAADLTAPEQIETLEDLGITVFQVPNPADFDQLLQIITEVGVLTGRIQDAEVLVDDLADRVSRVKESLAGVEPQSVFYEVDGSDPTAPWTTGSGTFQDFMIRFAAGENIASDIQGWGQMNLEDIIARDPDVILFASGPWVPTTVDSFADRAGWMNLSAVENDRIYSVDTNWIDRPGPRLVDALELIAASIHPERFQP